MKTKEVKDCIKGGRKRNKSHALLLRYAACDDRLTCAGGDNEIYQLLVIQKFLGYRKGAFMQLINTHGFNSTNRDESCGNLFPQANGRSSDGAYLATSHHCEAEAACSNQERSRVVSLGRRRVGDRGSCSMQIRRDYQWPLEPDGPDAGRAGIRRRRLRPNFL